MGFNRRHAPLARALRDHVATARPLELLYRVNAGPLPSDHWLNDLEEGGGRLLGEGCHFVDFACWLVGGLPEHVSATLVADPGRPLAAAQSFTIVLDFADGSLATIAYTVCGSDRVGKEHVEAHAGGRTAVLDDFRAVELVGSGRTRRQRGRARDKGHTAQLIALRRRLEGGGEDQEPDPLDTMAVTLAALESGLTGCNVSLASGRRLARDGV